MDQGLQLRCLREDLLGAVQAADAVVPSNSAKPILTNLLITATEGSCEIQATDLQVGLRAVLRRLNLIQPGSVIVPARQLATILKESQSREATLTLELDGGSAQVRIALEDGDYRIPAVIGETFPAVSGFPAEVERLLLPADGLDRLLRKVAFAVDKDRTSAVLSGVLLTVADGELVFAATDGKVLAEAVRRDPGLAGGPSLHAILPATTVAHLSRILPAAKGEAIELAVAGRLIFIRARLGGDDDGAGSIQVELTSRLVEGSYPAYRNALPTGGIARASFAATALASAVRRTALMTTSAARGIVIAITPEGATLSNLTNTAGSARVPVACSYDGGGERVGMNAQYLQEVLRVFDGDELTIVFNGPGKGLIMRDGNDVTYLIMPITLPN